MMLHEARERRPLLPTLKPLKPKYAQSSDDEDLLSLPRAVWHRPRRKKQGVVRRSRGTSSAGDESRVSVYAVGDTVNCAKLLSRFEANKVRRPPGRWVDSLWENAVHSSVEEDQPRNGGGNNTVVTATTPSSIRKEVDDDDDGGDADDEQRLSLTTTTTTTRRGSPRRRTEPPHGTSLEEELSVRGGHQHQHQHQRSKHLFAFPFGCVVMWGFDKGEERAIVSGLLADTIAVVSGATSAAERVEAQDTMTFTVDYDGKINFKNDVVRLSSDDPLEKFSLAYAMAQSAKLFIWEARVDVTIQEVKHIPERLAATGRTDLTEKQISQMIGKVFIERTQVNLHSDILDSPDFLWEDDAHEPAYAALKDHLDVPERVTLLNDRLDILKELLEVLNTQLSNHHSSRLEIIVIWLIITEIAVSLLIFLFDRIFPPQSAVWPI